MILGHEAAGVVVEVGRDVTRAQGRATGSAWSRASPTRPAAPRASASTISTRRCASGRRRRCTASCARPWSIPADFTFKLPDNVSFAEGAMVEPLAVGVHAATKAQIQPGDIAVVIGAGPIGMVTVLAALAAGCARVIVSDVARAQARASPRKLGPGRDRSTCARSKLTDVVMQARPTAGVPTSCSSAPATRRPRPRCSTSLCPGGRVVLVGIPLEPFAFDVSKAQVKEARIENVFRYAHVYPRAVAMLASGKIDVKPLITDRLRRSRTASRPSSSRAACRRPRSRCRSRCRPEPPTPTIPGGASHVSVARQQPGGPARAHRASRL